MHLVLVVVGLQLVCLISVLARSKDDYCTITCRGKKHTLCLFPKRRPGPKCSGVEKRPLKDDDKENILHLHNVLRSKVARGKEKEGNPGPQPSASNMMEMVWDKELETIAERWALQCPSSHDGCRKTIENDGVGQNIAKLWSSKCSDDEDWNYVNSWYSEVENYDKNDVHNFDPGPSLMTIGHYTQVAWAITYKIGCARMCYKSRRGKPMKEQIVVCNYSPPGNMLTTPQYLTGRACSACPKGYRCSKKYPGLCTNKSARIGPLDQRAVQRSVKNATSKPTTKGLASNCHPSWTLLGKLQY